MRQAVRAIIVKDGNLLVMRRNKYGRRYVTLVGGGVETGETLEQALLRELAEETGVRIAGNPRKVFEEHPRESFGVQHVFLCEYAGGEPTLHPDSEEAALNVGGANIYTPGWLPVDELAAAAFVSPKLQAALLDAFKNGFPKTVQTL